MYNLVVVGGGGYFVTKYWGEGVCSINKSRGVGKGQDTFGGGG